MIFKIPRKENNMLPLQLQVNLLNSNHQYKAIF